MWPFRHSEDTAPPHLDSSGASVLGVPCDETLALDVFQLDGSGTTTRTPRTSEPSLLDALLMLERALEGRRVAMRDLLASVERTCIQLTHDLRVGDAVWVDQRCVRVAALRSGHKALTLDGGRLGVRMRLREMPDASLDDNRWFVERVRVILAAFTDSTRSQQRDLQVSA